MSIGNCYVNFGIGRSAGDGGVVYARSAYELDASIQHGKRRGKCAASSNLK